jgi:hypothetical protein
MNTMNKVNANVAAVVTAAGALVLIGMGAFSASAGEGGLKSTDGGKSIETAPAVICANGEQSLGPAVFNATQHVGTSAVEIVNTYIAKTPGWTHDNYNPAYTQAEALTTGANAVTQVDVRDAALRRIAVFTVSALDGQQSYLSRAYMCSTPVLDVIPGSAGDLKPKTS